jgi:hypothetical protein
MHVSNPCLKIVLVLPPIGMLRRMDSMNWDMETWLAVVLTAIHGRNKCCMRNGVGAHEFVMSDVLVPK